MKQKKPPPPMSRGEISEALTGLSVAEMRAISDATGIGMSTLYRMREPGWFPRTRTAETVSAHLRERKAKSE